MLRTRKEIVITRFCNKITAIDGHYSMQTEIITVKCACGPDMAQNYTIMVYSNALIMMPQRLLDSEV